MGVYSTDRHNMSDTKLVDEVVANESFDHVTGPARAILEMHTNDMAIFEAVILNDMDTVRKVNEGVLLEAELSALNEASAKAIWDSIVAFLEKMAAKIKGMVVSFLTKIDLFITTDTSKIVDKYGKELLEKDLSGFKYKVRDFKNNEVLSIDVESLLRKYNDIVTGKFSDIDAAQMKSTIEGYTEDDALLRELLETTVPGLKISEVNEYHDNCFDNVFAEEKEVTGLDKAHLSVALTTLSISNGAVKFIKTQSDKDIREIQKSAKMFKTFSKDKTNEKDLQYLANCLYKVTAITQTAVVKSYSVWMDIVKFDVKQSRAIVTKAVTYNPKAPKEDAVKEAAFEDYCYDVAMDEADSYIEAL